MTEVDDPYRPPPAGWAPPDATPRGPSAPGWVFVVGAVLGMLTTGLPLGILLRLIASALDVGEAGIEHGPEPGLADLLVVQEMSVVVAVVALASVIFGAVLWAGVHRARRRRVPPSVWPLGAVANFAWLTVVAALGDGSVLMLVLATGGIVGLPAGVAILVFSAPGSMLATWSVVRLAAWCGRSVASD